MSPTRSRVKEPNCNGSPFRVTFAGKHGEILTAFFVGSKYALKAVSGNPDRIVGSEEKNSVEPSTIVDPPLRVLIISHCVPVVEIPFVLAAVAASRCSAARSRFAACHVARAVS